ncbi:MAG: type II secretion system protein GspN [Deltaproteobacteria bacterium]|nr:type II secretion system protein GspN [Deltaproteobacteria bacterium]
MSEFKEKLRDRLDWVGEKFGPIAKKIGKWVGYPLFFIFCFVLFAYWTFPYERAKRFIIEQVEYTQRGGQKVPSGYQLEIVDLGPSGLTGLSASGVRLVKLPETADERPVDVTIEEANVSLGVLSLLVGTLSVDFDVAVAGGDIEGSFSQDGSTTEIEATIEDVKLRRVGVLRGMLGLPVAGELGGEVDLVIAEEAADTTGSIELSIDGLAIGDGNTKLQIEGIPGDGLTVERLDAGNVEFYAAVEEGSANIERLEGRGPDIDLDGAGTLRLLQPLPMSRLDLMLRADIKDSYRERNGRTQGMFMLIDNNRRAGAAKTPDGAFQFRISGTFGGRISGSPAGRAPMPGR